jgi:hypothetical protein
LFDGQGSWGLDGPGSQSSRGYIQKGAQNDMISVESSGSGSGSGPPVETENLGPPKVPKVAAIAAIGFSYVFLNIPSTLCFFVATTFRTFQLMKLIVTSGKREGGAIFHQPDPSTVILFATCFHNVSPSFFSAY